MKSLHCALLTTFIFIKTEKPLNDAVELLRQSGHLNIYYSVFSSSTMCFLIIKTVLSLLSLHQQLFNCQLLHRLSMPDNDLTVLPTAIANLINLRELDVSKNSKQNDHKFYCMSLV